MTFPFLLRFSVHQVLPISWTFHLRCLPDPSLQQPNPTVSFSSIRVPTFPLAFAMPVYSSGRGDQRVFLKVQPILFLFQNPSKAPRCLLNIFNIWSTKCCLIQPLPTLSHPLCFHHMDLLYIPRTHPVPSSFCLHLFPRSAQKFCLDFHMPFFNLNVTSSKSPSFWLDNKLCYITAPSTSMMTLLEYIFLCVDSYWVSASPTRA